MAFIDLDSEDPQGNASFYNLTASVGYGGKNFEEDVKVVQFFLNRVYTTERFKDKKPWGNMVADGKCGPITRAWITKFQQDVRSYGSDCMVDGLVDKAGNESNPDNWTGSISNTHYTIRFINNVLRKQDTYVYKTLTTNPVVPDDMRALFTVIQAAGPAMNYAES
ncbi:MAG TPA: hypothetical protein VJL58_12335 [Pyrinomonadaceae bacterium]|nr:hypothetical protein [Pyrinomonadaceae bacterium]